MYREINLDDVPSLKDYSKSKLTFPINYDEDLAFLGECIRVEGSLNKGTKNMSFGNSDISLLKEVERILSKFNCHIYRTLRISMKIPESLSKEDIKIIDLSTNRIKEKFSIRHSTRFNKKFHELIFLETKIAYGSEKHYKIYLKDNFVEISIKIPEMSRIIVNPKREVTAVIQLIFANFALREVFRIILEIPEGRKSKIIFIPNILLNSQNSVISSAINAVLACEGFITYQKPPRSNRSIDLEMTSKQYIEGLKELLVKLGIVSYINTRKNRNVFSLHIYGKENLLKIKEIIKFTEPIKEDKFNYMLSTYRGFNDAKQAEGLITEAIKKLGKNAYIICISKLVGRKERTIRTYLGRMIKEGKLISSKTKPAVYYLSSKIS